jgi:hypothetical protein
MSREFHEGKRGETSTFVEAARRGVADELQDLHQRHQHHHGEAP